ncbi:MAG: RecQ family ATP-dependent DNA helicase [Planctomycetia bacterium]|nr:RecQ family ATP-dependent DNA helicase [Planctomycetia bacterium]
MQQIATPNLESFLPKFGLRQFRTGQREVISAVMAGHDCLCVMPTGGGKSLCYQLPSIARPGTTLVVSPLIALMQDQVQQLLKLNMRATFINSTLDTLSQAERIERMVRGDYDLVYVAAERFRSPRFIEAIGQVQVQLLAIDEAHCISEWGHDFRPDYAKLGKARARLGNPTTIALTATATPAVRKDIVAQLNFTDPQIFITGFARENLFYEVRSARGRQKDEQLLSFIRQTPGSGIVYVATRKKTEAVGERLAEESGRTVAIYHAGLLKEERAEAQDRFMSGKAQIVVATNAFGMGIDKADVRFVVHYNIPGTLEAYYQEAGRAGRDGRPSRCFLMFSEADAAIQEFFIESAYPAPEIVREVHRFLCSIDADPIELTQQEIKETLHLEIGAEGVGTCEQILEKAGVLERLDPYENMAVVRISSDLPTLVDMLPKPAEVQRKVLRTLETIVGPRRHELVYFQPRNLVAQAGLEASAVSRALRELRSLPGFEYVPPFRGRAVHVIDRKRPFEQLGIDFAQLQQRKQDEYAKLDAMLAYARQPRCRQKVILDYFGQIEKATCGQCDVCQPSAVQKTEGLSRWHDDPIVVEAVRIVLSGVARARRGKVTFGKGMIALMLCGSSSSKLKKFRLDELSTFGLLEYLDEDEVGGLIDALVAGDCLQQTELDRYRVTLDLTDYGREVMRGETGLQKGFRLSRALVTALREKRPKSRPPPKLPGGVKSDQPAAPAATPVSTPVPVPPAPSVARPPAPDPAPALAKARVTVETARPQPAAPAARSISPPAQAFKPIAKAPAPVAAPKINQTPTAGAAAASHPPYHWTWRLLQAGFSPAECAAARGLSAEFIFDHALRAAEAGLAVDPKPFLSQDVLAALQKVVTPSQPQQPRELLRLLPPGTRIEDVQLYLACRRVG